MSNLENREGSEQAPIEGFRSELNAFSEENKIHPLEDRIKRGLNEVGVLAIGKTNQIALQLATEIDADFDDVKKMSLGIQEGGPWEYAHALKDAKEPAVKAWMMISAATTMGREKEMDLVPEEFLVDMHRIETNLEDALENPEKAFVKARAHLLEEAQKTFRIEDGVPISEHDSGFVAMAVNGYEAGVLQDADGMLFVGAKEIDEEVLKEWGLKKELREDRGRKDVEFFVNEKGEALLKKIYPGFAVVLSRNFELAKAVAKASHEKTSKKHNLTDEALGHTRYEPTSAQNVDPEKEIAKFEFLRKNREPDSGEPSQETAMVRVKDAFYNELAYIKGQVIYLDDLKREEKKKEAKGKKLKPRDIRAIRRRTERKMEQKMEELKYMMDIIDPELDRLPEEERDVLDMAGGAGDLGLNIATNRLASGAPIGDVRIIDPFTKQEGFDLFADLIMDQLPMSEELKSKVHHENKVLQEVTIPDNAVVVAKHACGDLTDSIIEQWTESESPLLVIMTCCQEKACNNPARYNISQEDWKEWSIESAKTKEKDEEKLRQGMEAMTKLDMARVAYLKRHGFEAELHQTDKFPKGDVIVARRIKKS